MGCNAIKMLRVFVDVEEGRLVPKKDGDPDVTTADEAKRGTPPDAYTVSVQLTKQTCAPNKLRIASLQNNEMDMAMWEYSW